MGNEFLSNFCSKGGSSFSTQKSLRHNSIRNNDGPLKEILLDKNSQIKTLSTVPVNTKTIIRKLKGSPFEFNDVVDLLGVGSYGKVYKIRHKNTGLIRAMKVISKRQLKNNYDEKEIQNEIEVLKNVCHPNIIKLYEVYNDSESYYLINEYCSEGELAKYLIHFKKFPEIVIKHIMYELFTAIHYLHNNNIIHGDIKLENILIDNNTTNEQNKSSTYQKLLEEVLESLNKDKSSEEYLKLKNYAIKIIDFGCSKIFKENKEKNINGKGGTLVYSSPELLNNNYNSKCDIWSCGVIMYILLSGEIPFRGATDSEIQDKIIRGRFCFYNQYFKDISFEAKDLIRKCFVYNSKDRITAKEALEHPFFSVEIPKIINSPSSYETKNKTRSVISSLLSFSNQSKFFQVVLAYLTHNFAKKQETNELNQVFKLIDTDKDGKLSKNELKTCLETLGIEVTEEGLNNLLKRIDFDNDGFINYQEYLQATISTKDLFTDENLKSAFRLFDTHSDGTISVKELEEILGLTEQIDKGIIMELLKDIGKTEEDEFTFEEFKLFIMQYIEQKGDDKNYNTSTENTRISCTTDTKEDI